MEFGWIGQGYGFKSDKKWEDMKLDEVIYVPEYGIAEDELGNEYAESSFTKQDFINLCLEENCPINGEVLFNMVDWQFPETLLYELLKL